MNKKINKSKLKMYTTIFLCIIAIMAICSYTIGYTRILRNIENNTSFDNDLDNLYAKDNADVNNKNDKDTAISSYVVKINKDTKFCVVENDLVTARKLQKNTTIPEKFIGFTKVELEEYYANCIQNRTRNEVERGLETINILEFTAQEVKVEKVYDSSKVGYFIVDKGGVIHVFFNDKKTLYENTGILTKDLPQSERNLLKNGIYVDCENEVISILEGYSS